MAARAPDITSSVPGITSLFQATGRRRGSREDYFSIFVRLGIVVFSSWWEYDQLKFGSC